MRAESDPQLGLAVRVITAFDRDQIDELWPGASVNARIHCGQRALGYVWLYELIETTRGWLFL